VRLARFGGPGTERPAASLDDRSWSDISGVVPDFDGAVLENCLPEIAAAVRAGGLPRVAEGERFGPPLGRPGKIVCVGLNRIGDRRLMARPNTRFAGESRTQPSIAE
jgi:hypothetical protein